MHIKIENISIKKLSELYRKKDISPVEVVMCLLQQIKLKNNVNAFVTVLEEFAIQTAKESENRFFKGTPLSSMDGVPYSAKDIFFTKGILTSMGSEIYKNYIPTENAHVIDLLNGSGAVLLGKTNTHEFASGATSDRSFFGPTLNPHNLSKIPGGSSGGSGAALAARLCPAALGSDTTGSVRIPASACGVVGMKPTQGRVSRFGVYPLSDTLDHIGPMTRDVDDNAILLNAISGFDQRDPFSLKIPVDNFNREIGSSVEGLVVGVPYDLFEDSTDPLVYSYVNNSIVLLKSHGVKIKNIRSLDPNGIFLEACRIIRICEAYALHENNIMDKPHLYNSEVINQIRTGSKYSACEYIKSLQLRQKFKTYMHGIFEEVDIILMPTMPIIPTDIEQRHVTVRGTSYSVFSRFGLYTTYASLSGCPAISIPCGITSDNIPIGVQLMSKELNEPMIYRFASLIEKELGLDI